MNQKAQILTLFFMVPGSRHYIFRADILLIHLIIRVARLNNTCRAFGEILTQFIKFYKKRKIT
jgi:hypothetical protein